MAWDHDVGRGNALCDLDLLPVEPALRHRLRVAACASAEAMAGKQAPALQFVLGGVPVQALPVLDKMKPEEIVEQLRGTIRVRSGPPETEFVVALPLEPAKPKLTSLLMTRTSGNSCCNSSICPSGEALSTTIISKLRSVVCW